MNYQPRGLFDPNIFTEAQLLELKNTAFNLLKQGKTLMTWSGEGTSASRQFTMPPAEMLIEVTWSLKSGWPSKYGHLATSARQWRY